MEPITPELSSSETELLRLGNYLGRNETLAHIKGFCAAERAHLFRLLKEGKIYKRYCDTWDEFCPMVLKMSRSEADRRIAALEKFGPRYFAVAELTPVSPENFHVIDTAVKDDAILFNGESIPLTPDNAAKVATAVAALRRRARQSAEPQPIAIFDELKALDRRAQSVIASFQALSAKTSNSEGLIEFIEILQKTMSALASINNA